MTPAASPIAAVNGQTSYGVPWTVTQPAGTYKLWVYCLRRRRLGVGTAHSAGTITIGQRPTPTIVQPQQRQLHAEQLTTVHWTMSCAVSSGTFRVWLKNTVTGAWSSPRPPAPYRGLV